MSINTHTWDYDWQRIEKENHKKNSNETKHFYVLSLNCAETFIQNAIVRIASRCEQNGVAAVAFLPLIFLV